MGQESAEFWVCADPEQITEFLSLEPTTAEVNGVYSYWRFEISEKTCRSGETLADLLTILKGKEVEITQISKEFAVGIILLLETDQPHRDHLLIEIEDMTLLSHLGIPLCIKVHPIT